MRDRKLFQSQSEHPGNKGQLQNERKQWTRS